jgi:hypothetical protein
VQRAEKSDDKAAAPQRRLAAAEAASSAALAAEVPPGGVAQRRLLDLIDHGPRAEAQRTQQAGLQAGPAAAAQRRVDPDVQDLKRHLGIEPGVPVAQGLPQRMTAHDGGAAVPGVVPGLVPGQAPVQMVQPADKTAALALTTGADLHNGSGPSTPVGRRHTGPHTGTELRAQLTNAGDTNIPASFVEYDVNPKAVGGRDAERIVVGGGRVWYTGSHYAVGSFVELT